MVGTNYSIAHRRGYATLSARVGGKTIPLVSSKDNIQVESIYDNILNDIYKDPLELCKDIQSHFKLESTMLVMVTLQSDESSKAIDLLGNLVSHKKKK